ncbi:MAG: hypothetical protein AB1705_16180, partial [Verrucomicrobiota bacterium]
NRNSRDGFRRPPIFEPRIDAREPGVSNGWKRVWMIVEDNYGNALNDGLPPRVPGKTTGPRTIWRVRAWFCADDRSRCASNSFYAVPGLRVPEAMQAAPLPVTNFNVGPASVRLSGLAGAGYTTYSNGTIVRILAPTATGGGLGYSSSSSGTGPTRIDQHYLDGNIPHVALTWVAPRTVPLLYHTLCAVNPTSGERLSLSQYSKPRPELGFQWFHQTNMFVVGQLAGTLTNWPSFNLLIGLHEPLAVDFFIEQPEYTAGTPVP